MSKTLDENTLLLHLNYLKAHVLRAGLALAYKKPQEGNSMQDLARTRDYVRSVAMKYVRNDQDAEDVTQDAMLLAHRYKDSFRGESRYTTWLYRVTATAALMFLRRQRRLSRELPASGASDDEGTPWLERQPAAGDMREALIARDELDG